jgi:hypothetical protein
MIKREELYRLRTSRVDETNNDSRADKQKTNAREVQSDLPDPAVVLTPQTETSITPDSGYNVYTEEEQNERPLYGNHKVLHIRIARKYTLICSSAIAAIIVGLIIGYVLYHKSFITPLDNSVAAADFPLYYPKTLPDNLSYQSGSARVQNDVAFFGLKEGSQVITVSEQAAPSKSPSIGQLSGFKSINTKLGSAYIGSVLNSYTVIIVSPKTLMTIHGSSNVSESAISQIAASMSKVQ